MPERKSSLLKLIGVVGFVVAIVGGIAEGKDLWLGLASIGLPILALAALIALLVYLAWSRKAEGGEWSDQFLWVGRGSKLVASKITTSPRDMSQTFVPIKRSARLPLQLIRVSEEQKEITDLEAYLRQQRTSPGWPGVLLQAEPFVGKTRFATEFIRSNCPDALVLIPKRDGRIKTPSPPSESTEIILLLDDADKFESNVNLDELVAAIRAKCARVWLFGTVRFAKEDGDLRSQDRGVDARFWRELEHLELDRPSEEDRELVSIENKIVQENDLPDFGFVVAKGYEAARGRFREDLTKDAQAAFRIAARLYANGIERTRERWQSLYTLRHGHEGFGAAYREVVSCFGFKHELNEDYLRFVPGTDWNDAASQERLLDTLVEATDFEAILQWGRGLVRKKGADISYAATILRSVAKAAVRADENVGTPAGWIAAAKAVHSLGYRLSESGEIDLAIDAYKEAVGFGGYAKTPEGWVAASRAGYALGFQLTESHRISEAIDAYRTAVGAGENAENPEGWAAASEAGYALGYLLIETCKTTEAIDAFRAAIGAGENADNPKGWTVASKAGYALGFRLAESQRICEAIDAYRSAVGAGEIAQTPEGWSFAARSGLNLGNNLVEIDEAIQVYKAAVRAGEISETPNGLVDASKAGHNLGIDLARIGKFDEAIEAYEAAVCNGEKPNFPEGWGEASKAGLRLGDLLSRAGKIDEAIDVYKAAVRNGERANDADGKAIAASAAIKLGHLRH